MVKVNFFKKAKSKSKIYKLLFIMILMKTGSNYLHFIDSESQLVEDVFEVLSFIIIYGAAFTLIIYVGQHG